MPGVYYITNVATALERGVDFVNIKGYIIPETVCKRPDAPAIEEQRSDDIL